MLVPISSTTHDLVSHLVFVNKQWGLCSDNILQIKDRLMYNVFCLTSGVTAELKYKSFLPPDKERVDRAVIVIVTGS